MNALTKLIVNVSKYIAIFGLLTGVFLTFINVVARYGFNYSITWASELSVYLFVWGIFFGSTYVFKLDSHIFIGFLVESVNKKLSKKIMIFTKIISITFLSIVSFYGYKYILLVVELEETSIDLEIPMWIPYLVIPISFALSAYVVLDNLIKLIKTPYMEIVFISEAQDLLEEIQKKSKGLV
jgi:C4-dicarboxylate transporter DctQ subunit